MTSSCRRTSGLLLMTLVATAPLGAQSAPPPSPVRGFPGAMLAAQRMREDVLRAVPDPDTLRAQLIALSAFPHEAGTDRSRRVAEAILSRFRAFGLDASIEQFEALMPRPLSRSLQLLSPERYTAQLREPSVPGDPTSGQQEQLPTFNAYSPDGDVSAELVYVNYGVPDDYRILDSLGISVRGKIVIARYGGSWRGVKPKVAAEHGAIGCLIYSDPHEDGYFGGDVFPDGPWRPADGVQRGSVSDMLYEGDPLTPGVGATRDAKRLAVKDVEVLTRIPVMPLSWADAEPLLRELGGPMAPQAWRGALPFPYRVGPGPAKVHLAIKSSWDLKPIYDVIARIPGSTDPDEWVIRGNHHDAWVNGAEDPISGQVALLEEARAFAELLKQGWRPRRTIIYAAWDGEEAGCLGSTEWVETHAAELAEHAVAYLNSDSNGRGFLEMEGSQTLEGLVNGVARDVTDPETGLSVWKRLQLRRIERAKSADERTALRTGTDLRVDAAGSGSDYAAFLDHLGIPSLSLGYGGEDDNGIYHSIYDDFYWYTHFSDATFVYGRALAQTVGTAVMRLADAELLPFEFAGLADAVHRYVGELKTLLARERDDARERDAELEEGVFRATSDPKRPSVAPPPQGVPPHLNFAPLENAVEALERASQHWERALAKARVDGAPGGAGAVNRTLLGVDRAMLDPVGLPRRPWYRNMLYAPGRYTGYDVKTLPMAREAIELRSWPEAEDGIARAARAVDRVAAAIERAAAQLEAAKP